MPKLLDRVRAALRGRHYAIRTEDAYADWVKRYILFHNKRQQVLDLVGGRVAEVLGPLPLVLPLGLHQQPTDVPGRLTSGLAPREPGPTHSTTAANSSAQPFTRCCVGRPNIARPRSPGESCCDKCLCMTKQSQFLR
ncbi:phage integrase N-terminal SAM-like domain-containing protein [bacterium]|nr:phage integrase N-terminal SAM-like domain-containing protein [bacterium]